MKKYCPDCMKEYGENFKFCTKCGTELQEMKEAEKESAEATQEQEEIKKTPATPQIDKRIIVGCVAAVLIILIGAFINSVYNSPSNLVMRRLEEGNFGGAQYVYQERVSGDHEEVTKLAEKLQDKIEEIKEAYINETMDYLDAESYLSAISNLGIYLPDSHDAYMYVIELQSSRDAYKNAEEFMKAEDYVLAIENYKYVLDIDKNYEDAQNKLIDCQVKLKENALSEANALMAEEKYTDAIQVLDNVIVVLGEDAMLTSLKEDCQNKELTKQLQAFYDAGDWVGGITYAFDNWDILQNIAGNEAYALYAYMRKMYTNQVLDDAKAAYQNIGYWHAAIIVEDGLNILKSDSYLQNALDEINSCAPKSLHTDIEPYYKDMWFPKSKSGVQDNMGNVYGYAFACGGLYDGHALYNLDGKYNILTGVAGVAYKDNDIDVYGKIQIYGDGVLLWEKNDINGLTKPIQLTIDVTGVKDLDIYMKGGYYVFSSVTPMLADLQVQKTTVNIEKYE